MKKNVFAAILCVLAVSAFAKSIKEEIQKLKFITIPAGFYSVKDTYDGRVYTVYVDEFEVSAKPLIAYKEIQSSLQIDSSFSDYSAIAKVLEVPKYNFDNSQTRTGPFYIRAGYYGWKFFNYCSEVMGKTPAYVISDEEYGYDNKLQSYSYSLAPTDGFRALTGGEAIALYCTLGLNSRFWNFIGDIFCTGFSATKMYLARSVPVEKQLANAQKISQVEPPESDGKNIDIVMRREAVYNSNDPIPIVTYYVKVGNAKEQVLLELPGSIFSGEGKKLKNAIKEFFGDKKFYERHEDKISDLYWIKTKSITISGEDDLARMWLEKNK